MRFLRIVESSQELFLMSFFSSSGCTCQQCYNRICLDTAFLWSDQHPAWAKMERDSCASVTLPKTILVDERLDAIISEGINIPRRSMKWLPLLFYELNIASARDREKAFNPDIIEWKVIVNGIPNKLYSQGMQGGKRYVGTGLQKIW